MSVDLWGKGASLVARLVKNLPAVQETWVRPLGRSEEHTSELQSLNQAVQPVRIYGSVHRMKKHEHCFAWRKQAQMIWN